MFNNNDYMLGNKTAKYLYHRYCENLPIIDYHCHVSPREICEDTEFENITQVWLYHDHYKWRIMRACGVDERYITGNATDYEKFLKYAEALEMAIGNPVYIWSHMELEKYFGVKEPLNPRTADSIWHKCNAIIRDEHLSARKIIRDSDVELICTTDDPCDDLRWHREIEQDRDFHTRVIPTWRPDRFLNIENNQFSDAVKELEGVSGKEINSYNDFIHALQERMRFFNSNGTCIADHGIDTVPFRKISNEEVNTIFKKRLRGQPVNGEEAEAYKTQLLISLAESYNEFDWAMQIHYGCERNVNTRMYRKLGPDTGYDVILDENNGRKLTALLDQIEQTSKLPRIILYSLNPADDALIDSIIGAFQNGTTGTLMQHGSAWWFNDNKVGIEHMLDSLAARGVLGEFIGMLTDSRSFLSYTRHDYFRRLLCNRVGKWVEDGSYPYDEESLKEIVVGISYSNAKKYFGFEGGATVGS